MEVSKNFSELKARYLVRGNIMEKSEDLLKTPLFSRIGKYPENMELLNNILTESIENLIRYEINPDKSSESISIPEKCFRPLVHYGLRYYPLLSMEGPYISAAIIELLEKDYGNLSLIPPLESGDTLYLKYKKPLEKIITGQDYWVFYLQNPYNCYRLRPIKIRHVRLLNYTLPREFSVYPISWPAEDLDTREHLLINEQSGWVICLSKKDLSERLHEIRDTWAKNSENRLGGIDLRIKNLKKEIKTLITERKYIEKNLINHLERINKLLKIENE